MLVREASSEDKKAFWICPRCCIGCWAPLAYTLLSRVGRAESGRSVQQMLL